MPDFEFQSFGSIEEMFAAMQSASEQADAQVLPWQEDIKPGDYFVRVEEGLAIYGEVLPYPDETPDESGDSPEELTYSNEPVGFYTTPEGRNYRFTKCYSEACPDGEMGDTHVSVMHTAINKPLFEMGRNMGWPKSIPVFWAGMLMMANRHASGHYWILMYNSDGEELRSVASLECLNEMIKGLVLGELFVWQPFIVVYGSDDKETGRIVP